MKVWSGYGTEHSANLVIIGNFKTIEAAAKTKKQIEDLSELALAEYDERDCEASLQKLACGKMSKEILDYYSANNIGGGRFELQGLINDYSMDQKGKDLIITTNDIDINAFLSYMISSEAKVQEFSAHNYKSAYGRPTYDGADKA